MAFMHQAQPKQVIAFILISTLVLFSVFSSKKKQPAEADDIRALDAKLLTDLQHQPVAFDSSSLCIMQCAGITEADLRALFSASHVDYDHAGEENCHFTAYAIKGITPSGQQVQFQLEAGEDGNVVHALSVGGNHCDCAQ